MIFISGHTPKTVGTMFTLGPFHSTTLDLLQTKGLTVGVACRSPPPFTRVGEWLSRNTPTGAQLALIFCGTRERRGRFPIPSPHEGGDTLLQYHPEFHVLEQERAEKE